MEWLFSWEVTSLVVVTFVGIGLTFVGLNDFKLAKLCFFVAAAHATGGMAMWGTKTDVSQWVRIPIVFVVMGVIGVLAVQSFRYIDSKKKAQEPGTKLLRRHTLAEPERGRFELPLREQKEPKDMIRFGCPPSDENICLYAGQFIDLFREAGWQVEGNEIQRVVLGKPKAGVILFLHGTGTLDPSNWRSGLWAKISPSLQSIRKAFLSIGVEPDIVADENGNIPEGVIGVYFGVEKDNPKERTALTDAMEQLEQHRNESPPKPEAH